MKALSNNALGMLILLGIIWGTGYAIARFVTTHGLSPVTYSFWLACGPAIVLLFTQLFLNPKKTKLNSAYLKYYFICALLGIVIPNTNMYMAASHLPAGLLALIVNTVPLIAYPLALLANLERFSWLRLIAVTCGVIGVAFIILPKSSLPSSTMIPWAISALITPISFACSSIYIAKNRPPNSNSLRLATGTLWVASIMLLPAFFHQTSTSHSAEIILILILSILLSSLGYLLFFQLIKVAGPVYYSFVDTLVTLTGLGWGYALFNERLNQWTSTAVVFILLALFLISYSHKKQNNAIKV